MRNDVLELLIVMSPFIIVATGGCICLVASLCRKDELEKEVEYVASDDTIRTDYAFLWWLLTEWKNKNLPCDHPHPAVCLICRTKAALSETAEERAAREK